MPRLFYGSQVWRCAKEEMKRVNVSYSNTFRCVFGFKKFESVKLLQFFCNVLPLDHRVALDKIKFICCIQSSCNDVLK